MIEKNSENYASQEKKTQVVNYMALLRSICNLQMDCNARCYGYK